MLELIDVTKTFAFGTGELSVLDKVSIEVGPAQSVSIMGPSGSGKTTLLNLMGGLDKPTDGKVMLDRKNLASLREGELARLRNTQIGFVFQLHYLLSQCTVLENVLLPILAMRKSELEKKSFEKRAFELLERVGLKDYADAHPGQLSGGQRQRAAVVRALILKPQVLLADEPTGSLDAETAEQIANLLMELNRTENVALVLATHSEPLAQKAQRCYQLKSGVLAQVF